MSIISLFGWKRACLGTKAAEHLGRGQGGGGGGGGGADVPSLIHSGTWIGSTAEQEIMCDQLLE